jgi:hypothetical protein
MIILVLLTGLPLANTVDSLFRRFQPTAATDADIIVSLLLNIDRVPSEFKHADVSPSKPPGPRVWNNIFPGNPLAFYLTLDLLAKSRSEPYHCFSQVISACASAIGEVKVGQGVDSKVDLGIDSDVDPSSRIDIRIVVLDESM